MATLIHSDGKVMNEQICQMEASGTLLPLICFAVQIWFGIAVFFPSETFWLSFVWPTKSTEHKIIQQAGK